MKIHLIRKETLETFAALYPMSRLPLTEWISKIKFADWRIPTDIKKVFPSADLLGKGSNRAVFDIGGNNFRIIAKYAFGVKEVHLYICWIGNHAEYNKVCKKGHQFIISVY